MWTECVFADPIADVAVLGPPDSQSVLEPYEGYLCLTLSTIPMAIGDIAAYETPTPARLIGLDGQFIGCTVQHFGGQLLIEDTTEAIKPGMSGSPLLDATGAAIGVLSKASATVLLHPEAPANQPLPEPKHKGRAAPRLAVALPGSLLVNLGVAELLVAAAAARDAYLPPPVPFNEDEQKALRVFFEAQPRSESPR